MAKKVTISIPDMLYEKLEKWRESFNLSKMFQEAVSEAIQRKEEFQKRIREDLDFGQIVERLRREKIQAEGNSLESGKKDGIQWAKIAHYNDLQYVLQWTDLEQATKDPVLGDYFAKIHGSNQFQHSNTYYSGDHFPNYVKGWKQGVEQFWEEVRDRL